MPLNGPTIRELQLQLAGTPGGLANVVLCFSTLQIAIHSMEYDRQRETVDCVAAIIVRYSADARASDLLQRRLSRIIEVISVDESTIAWDQNNAHGMKARMPLRATSV